MAAQQDDVGLVAGQIGTSAHGHRHLCLGQHRRVIHAVAHHGDHRIALLQGNQATVLVLGGHAAKGLCNPETPAQRLDRRRRITTEDGQSNTLTTQGFESCGAILPETIGKGKARQPSLRRPQGNHRAP